MSGTPRLSGTQGEKKENNGPPRRKNESTPISSTDPNWLSIERVALNAHLASLDQREYRDDGQRYSPLWHFVRELKSHPIYGAMSPEEVYDEIAPLFESGRIDLEALGCNGDPYFEFIETWEAIRWPYGVDPLEHAVRSARPEALGECNARAEKYRRFVTTAIQLQQIAGDRNIYLPVERLALLLGTDKMAVSRYRKRAVREGILKLVRPHEFNGAGGGRATEFRAVPLEEAQKSIERSRLAPKKTSMDCFIAFLTRKMP